MPAAAEPRVVDAPERERFELLVGDELVGFVEYRRRPSLIAFTHTEVDPSHEGKGYGGILVKGALAAARAAGLEVLPFCPFVTAYLARHPDDVELVPEAYRERFDL